MKSKYKYLKIVIALALILIAIYPFLPELIYPFQNKQREELIEKIELINNESGDVSKVEENLQQNGSEKSEEASDLLIIPSIGLEYNMIVGGNESALKTAIWAKSNIIDGGNTVITGHRFGWTSGAGPFYHLPKVQIGDEIVLQIDNVTYFYKVTGKQFVESNATWIEKSTYGNEIITLYTCDTLLAGKRFVVVAKPV